MKRHSILWPRIPAGALDAIVDFRVVLPRSNILAGRGHILIFVPPLTAFSYADIQQLEREIHSMDADVLALTIEVSMGQVTLVNGHHADVVSLCTILRRDGYDLYCPLSDEQLMTLALMTMSPQDAAITDLLSDSMKLDIARLFQRRLTGKRVMELVDMENNAASSRIIEILRQGMDVSVLSASDSAPAKMGHR